MFVKIIGQLQVTIVDFKIGMLAMSVSLVVICRNKGVELVLFETDRSHVFLGIERAVQTAAVTMHAFLCLLFCDNINYTTHGI